MNDPLSQLDAVTTHLIHLRLVGPDAQLCEPTDEGAIAFKIRMVDVGSVGVDGIAAVLQQDERTRYARQFAAAGHAEYKRAYGEDADAFEDAPSEEEAAELEKLNFIANAVSRAAVLMAGMVAPTYEEAQSRIHRTPFERALYRAILARSGVMFDPKSPAGA